MTLRAKSCAGTVTLETVLAFPVLLLLILGCIQLSQIWVARSLVHYAAFCAARAGLVTVCGTSGPSARNDSWARPDERQYPGLQAAYTRGSAVSGRAGKARSEAEYAGCRAAATACSLITVGAGGSGALRLPGWGEVRGSSAREIKTRAAVRFSGWNVEATAEHDLALVVPVVNHLVAGTVRASENVYEAVSGVDPTGDAYRGTDPWPHIRVTESAALPKPYRTVLAAGNWKGYPPRGAGRW